MTLNWTEFFLLKDCSLNLLRKDCDSAASIARLEKGRLQFTMFTCCQKLFWGQLVSGGGGGGGGLPASCHILGKKIPPAGKAAGAGWSDLRRNQELTRHF